MAPAVGSSVLGPDYDVSGAVQRLPSSGCRN